MEEEFEAIVLHCGHSINSYSGLGVCSNCRMKNCGRCLQLTNGELLCPKCFTEKLEAGK
jgi:hypothetical protein